MVMKGFKGAAKPLDRFDIPALAYRIDVSEDHLQAFLNVESRSKGFDREGRPIILTEPHVFYRNLSGEKRARAVKAGLAYKRWGTKPYPKTQNARYQWVKKAANIDLNAALMACSWGSTQVLGENYKMIGYSSVKAMVEAFMDDEENHVEGMVNFILASGIADDLRAERWSVVARVYNGPGYKRNKYDSKMASEFAKLRLKADAGWSPDQATEPAMEMTAETLKTVQRRLGALGYKEVGWADGAWGTKTRAAVLAFRADHGLPIVPQIDKTFMASLMTGVPRPISDERLDTDAQGLREAGSRTIKAADKGAAVGGLITVGGVVSSLSGSLDSLKDQLGGLTGLTDALSATVDALSGVSPWLLALLGGYLVYQQVRIKRARVEDHRTGKTSYPGGQ